MVAQTRDRCYRLARAVPGATIMLVEAGKVFPMAEAREKAKWAAADGLGISAGEVAGTSRTFTRWQAGADLSVQVCARPESPQAAPLGCACRISAGPGRRLRYCR
jgi:hypothetical protein